LRQSTDIVVRRERVDFGNDLLQGQCDGRKRGLSDEPDAAAFEMDAIDLESCGVPMRGARSLGLVRPPLMVVFRCRRRERRADDPLDVGESQRNARTVRGQGLQIPAKRRVFSLVEF
jgi:hypothetical protein